MSTAISIDVAEIPAPVMSAHCRGLLNAIGNYFDDPEHRIAYEKWHVDTYGHPPKTASYMGAENNNHKI